MGVYQVGKADDKQQATEAESKYSRRELIANGMAVFGVMPEVVEGALHGNSAQELTVAEVKAAVYDFLKRKVK